jgi:phosphoribosyl 1,2-cyclic phosphodiesterase
MVMIKFLGTAGARFVVSRQLRYSAGIYLSSAGENVIIDPGPGALLRLAKSRPKIDVSKIDAIILTHTHIDHSSDVNVIIDAMTGGGLKKRGELFAPPEALAGENSVILNYLEGFLERITPLKPEGSYKAGNLRFETSVRHVHGAETYGLKFMLKNKKVSFISDTLYFPELIDSYAGSDVLIINTVRLNPHESQKILHLCAADVIKLVKGIKPREVYLTHFGMTMLKAKPWKVAEKLSNELGVKVTAAADGMEVDL